MVVTQGNGIACDALTRGVNRCLLHRLPSLGWVMNV